MNLRRKEQELNIADNLVINSQIFERLKPTMELKSFKKKDVLIYEEYNKDKYFLIKSGIARAYTTDIKGKEFIKTLYTFGMPLANVKSIATGEDCPIKYDCLTDIECYIGDYNQLRKLAKNDIHIAYSYAKLMESVYLSTEERVFELTQTAEKKFIILKDRIPDIENLIPQYQIASYLNITNVQLSRVRKKMLFG